VPDENAPEPGKAVGPRTTDEWLAGNSGVETFRSPDGQIGMSFKPQFVAQFNFLGPQAQVVQLDASYRPIPKVILLSIDTDAYVSKGKYNLTKQGLVKLADLAGIEKDGDTERDAMFDGEGNIVRETVTVRVKRRAMDGTWRRTSASKTIWYVREETKIRRENSHKQESAVNELVDEWFQNAPQKAETGAQLRAIREMLGIKGGYTKIELQKPFFVMSVAFVPDWSNPRIASLLSMEFGKGVEEAFGEGPGTASLPPAPPRAPAELSGGDLASAAWDDEADNEDEEPPAHDGAPDPEPPPPAEEPPAEEEPIDATVVEQHQEFPKPPPEQSFTPKAGDFAGVAAAELVMQPEGRLWLGDALSRMKDPQKIAHALAWLSWALQREITMDNLDTLVES